MRCTIVAAALLAAACSGKSAPAPAPSLDDAQPKQKPVRSYQVDIEERLSALEHTVAKLQAALDKQAGAPAPDPAAIYAIPIDARDPIDGPADAKLTIVFAFDLIDPYTALAAPVALAAAARHPADIRIVWKYISLGAPAIGPGLVACGAAAQHKWPAARDAMFADLYQHDKLPRPLTEKDAFDQLQPLAAKAGLDLKQLAVDRPPCEAWFETGKAALAAVGTSTTPAFYFNGAYAGGYLDDAAFEAKVVAALAAATQQMATDHVGAAEFYAREVLAKGLAKIKSRWDD